jgi:putative membrane protein
MKGSREGAAAAHRGITADRLRGYETSASIIMLVFYAVGLAGHLIGASRSRMQAMTPFVLLIFGLAAMVPVLLEARRGVLLWSALVLAVTFILEATGTATGKIFGPYTYGPTLGWRLFDVPVVIALNWLLVILGFTLLARRWTRRPLPASFLAAALAAAFDVLLEPVAVRLQYWTWQTPSIPLQNTLAWFLIALASSLAFMALGLSARSRLPTRYVLIQTLFFAGLRIALGE